MLFSSHLGIMLQIYHTASIPEREIEISAVRSQGAGGQNVNKVATAIHLRFNIKASSLPERYKERLLNLNDRRITEDGIVIIKAQEHRSQLENREEALRRLQELIQNAVAVPKKRFNTKQTRSSQRKRLDSKTKRGQLKAMRRKITD
ncbi:alternative ribosome rescue aminoacyl-tRNA hydrolase ArfB [Kamptonema sp. UHCC 0994]|nr:alternative ribosome rescue aminoacyl-tRNA hydrolase ArfB [Kamptonema sp. UHCC 0994]MDF0556380.1 alternative ribosome rescue aminoacyl-tRNA hydrolase ArfB [Kamptonema sp. UHCC 0994]